jgi:hypothetical protein
MPFALPNLVVSYPRPPQALPKVEEKVSDLNMSYIPTTADQPRIGLDNAQPPSFGASLVAADCSIYPFFQQSTPLSDHIQTALRLL